ncbi:hypothetical protein GOV07_04240 [Candidatus Woesearchaeota archaeon]|nr:hypothetical protein [Candidatus Woesearchaeota archaeon]
MGEIVIRYSGRLMERTIYLVIIGILAMLLIFSYLGDNDCDPDEVTDDVEEDTDVAPPETNETEEPEVEPEPEPTETCLDGIKNQDETDVDCGGSSCNSCDEGKDCELNSDCREAVCNDDMICKASPDLSGERTIKITNVDFIENDGSTAKVSEVSFRIDNGVDEILSARVEIWVKTDDALYYLAQPMDEEEDGENPYGEYSLPLIPAGEKRSYTVDRDSDSYSSGYLFSIPTGAYYDPGDDFIVEVKLIGKTGEGIIDTATYAVNV